MADGAVAADLVAGLTGISESSKAKDGRVTIDLKTTELNPKPDENHGYFSIATGTPNGIDVLETWFNGGAAACSGCPRADRRFEYDDRGRMSASSSRAWRNRAGDYMAAPCR